MVVPLLIALAVVGAGGVVAGGKGVLDLRNARSTMKTSQALHAAAVSGFDVRREVTKTHLEQYGEFQFSVQRGVMAAFVSWLEANERRVRQIDRPTVDGVEAAVGDLPEMRHQILKAQSVVGPAVSSVVAGTAARGAALSGVSAFASASTGTAISSLSGAAANNAALAYLGGGSLASGGGGMAAGATVLSGIAIAPGMLIAGVTLGVQGQKAKTKVTEYAVAVDRSISHLDQTVVVLEAIESRADELRSVLGRAAARAQASLDRLTEVVFDPEQHAEMFLETAHLVRAVSELLSTPLLDAEGNLTDISITIIERYRTS